MLYRLTPTKKRIYHLSNCAENGAISGEYLTIEREWKERSFTPSTFAENLDAIPTFVRGVNLPNWLAVYMKPHLQKNLRRSTNFSAITSAVPFGKIKNPDDVSLQNIIQHLFPSVYAGGLPSMSLKNALYSNCPDDGAVYSEEGFLLDFQNKVVYYKGTAVGLLTKNRDIVLPSNSLEGLFAMCGITPKIVAEEKPREKSVSMSELKILSASGFSFGTLSSSPPPLEQESW